MQINEVLQRIDNYIRQFGGQYKDWYVGVTSDQHKRLFIEHGVQKEGDYWISIPCSTEQEARSVERCFLEKGCDGGPGGGDMSTRIVYAYAKGSHTNP